MTLFSWRHCFMALHGPLFSERSTDWRPKGLARSSAVKQQSRCRALLRLNEHVFLLAAHEGAKLAWFLFGRPPTLTINVSPHWESCSLPP